MKNEKRKTKNEKRKTKNEKRKTKNEKRKTKKTKPKCVNVKEKVKKITSFKCLKCLIKMQEAIFKIGIWNLRERFKVKCTQRG